MRKRVILPIALAGAIGVTSVLNGCGESDDDVYVPLVNGSIQEDGSVERLAVGFNKDILAARKEFRSRIKDGYLTVEDKEAINKLYAKAYMASQKVSRLTGGRVKLEASQADINLSRYLHGCPPDQTRLLKKALAKQGIHDVYVEKSDCLPIGSSCFLTTACTQARGLPDDCIELETARHFRDSVLFPAENTGKGRKFIRDYYSVAPAIVEGVKSRGKELADRVWDGVYDNVAHAVNLVKSGDFNAAFEHYKGMTEDLKEFAA